eukprot:TRINITY_DN17226_c0_g1_i1.p1 TRINITY_DN17226_c0_g1~~TRINITY_DN17226_c0_g1_i1.p1  ORF type:complete len:147 (-),score=20.80 TRINITY_DN17226_c0_g1_i1:113-520(-)
MVNYTRYCEDLKAPVLSKIGDVPHVQMHKVEWNKIMNGEPVEINPSTGSGYRVMSAEEWAARWKQNQDFPECLECNGNNTKEHFFTQSWCRGKKLWESELLCLDCHKFSYRSYKDPDFETPEEYEKRRWEESLAV